MTTKLPSDWLLAGPGGGQEVPRAVRPAEAALPEDGDHVPGGEGPDREARLRFPGDHLTWNSSELIVVIADRINSLNFPKLRTFNPKDWRLPDR